MDFTLTKEEEAFHDEVRDFINEHLSAEARKAPGFLASWLKAVRQKRWVGFNWPREYGGGGGGIMEQVILKEEMARADAPPLGLCMMGLQWVGPAIIEYGTEDQKRKFLPEILDSQYQWCTGYSEPGSGSDLASLQCKAVRDGDEYVVNGQKIWTSLAMWSKWIILLTRTEFSSRTSTRVSPVCWSRWTPRASLSGPSRTCPAARTSLRSSSRTFAFRWGTALVTRVRDGASRFRRWHTSARGFPRSPAWWATFRSWWELAKQTKRGGKPVSEHPSIRRRLAKADVVIEGMRLNGQRFLTKQLKGEPLTSETSINKLQRAFLAIELGDLALSIKGSAGQYVGKSNGAGGGDFKVPSGALDWPNVVIGGGTPNIQKNIIAERILGLPKD